MKKFDDWFKQNLKVSRYPTPQECFEMERDIIINVSDEYIHGCMSEALRAGKLYYWFPLNECTSDMGLNSIYAALQILSNAEKENKKVYLHCHAGANRSPTVADCFYYMRTGRFLEESDRQLRVINNIESGHLPAITRLKEFLKQCSIAFERDETDRGGYLDSCKLKSKTD